MPRGKEGEAVSDVLMPQGCEDKGRDCNPGVPEAALDFLGHFSRHSDSQAPPCGLPLPGGPGHCRQVLLTQPVGRGVGIQVSSVPHAVPWEACTFLDVDGSWLSCSPLLVQLTSL